MSEQQHQPNSLLTFHRLADGRVVVERWPERVDVTKQLILEADEKFLSRDGQLLRFRCSNGDAEYRIESENMREVHARLVCWTLEHLQPGELPGWEQGGPVPDGTWNNPPAAAS